MAGESARAMAADKRRRGKNLLREAELYDRGAEGEEATGRALAALPSASWTVIHDVHWPGRPHANIDHVVIGPSGVYVIDSKHWRGQVSIVEGALRRDGRSEQELVDATLRSASAIAGLVPHLDQSLVRPVLCFLTADTLAHLAGGVVVCTTTNLAALLLAEPTTLSAHTRQLLAHELDAQLWPAIAPVPTHAPVLPPARAARTKPTKPTRTTRTTRASGSSRRPKRSGRSGRAGSSRPPALARLALSAVMLIGIVVATDHPGLLDSVGEIVSGLTASK